MFPVPGEVVQESVLPGRVAQGGRLGLQAGIGLGQKALAWAFCSAASTL